jgi:predicted enzyme related to lactoylglutathione lyase
MPEVTKYEPGTFCWNQLSTNDADGAFTFYSRLFGWTKHEVPISDGEVYVVLQRNGKDVAALYQNAKVPPHWLAYVAVHDVNASAEKASSLGGTVVGGPMDVMDAGRMAVVQDPQGAFLALWQAGRHKGAELGGETGTFVWNELMTTSGESAQAFYSALFGWHPKVSPEYTEWHAGEQARGGMMERGDVPPNWLPYVMVDDVDAIAGQAQSSGGRMHVPPTDIPKVGRFAVLQDPQGAVFAVFKM